MNDEQLEAIKASVREAFSYMTSAEIRELAKESFTE